MNTNTESQLLNNKKIPLATRVHKLPVYIFASLADEKAKIDEDFLIDLSLGSPDSATPEHILNTIHHASNNIDNHGYPRFNGKPVFNQEIIKWVNKRFNINVQKEEQVLPLIGSKEGLAHLPLAYLEKGDVSLIPNPHYPVHYRGSIIAGADVHDMPLKQENDFLPVLDDIPSSVANKAKFMVISYPNNPTGAIATDTFMKELVEFCRKYNILLCHDLAYSELGFDNNIPKSIFEYMSLEENAIEFFTFSKTYHMAGWRIGFSIGNQDIVQNLYKLKTNMDYGVSGTIQDAAIQALNNTSDEYYQGVRDLYQERAEYMHRELTEKLGWDIFKPQGAMYLWLPAPEQYNGSGQEFAFDLLSKLGIATTPGLAFGSEGQKYTRIALVQPLEKLKEATKRIIEHYSASGTNN